MASLGETPPSETWTIGRLLDWTKGYFQERGIENPRLDAEVLLAHARSCQRIDLYATFTEEASQEVRTAFRELVRRRAEGTPVAYLVGHREFYSLSFAVTQDVLIPRPETELLVMTVLDLAKELPNDRQVRMVDVGTGSGNIAVAIATQLPRASVTAVDQSATALDVARQNAEKHGVAERVQFVEGNLLGSLPVEPGWDFIMSNPPYVSEAEYAELPREVKGHEPRSALVAGPSGTEVIERLIAESAARIAGGGWLVFEISPMIEQSVRALLQDHTTWQRVKVLLDLNGHARIVQARRAGAEVAVP